MPKGPDPKAVLGKIETLIRNAARIGKVNTQIPSHILPDGMMAQWQIGKHTPLVAGIMDALSAAGYIITSDAGGHHGAGYVKISWDNES